MAAAVSKLPVVEVTVDLDALRQARADTDPVKTFRLGGQVFTVPSKMPLYVGLLIGEGKMREAIRLWLGVEQEEAFAELGADDDDLSDLIRALYGVGMGESSASS